MIYAIKNRSTAQILFT